MAYLLHMQKVSESIPGTEAEKDSYQKPGELQPVSIHSPDLAEPMIWLK